MVAMRVTVTMNAEGTGNHEDRWSRPFAPPTHAPIMAKCEIGVATILQITPGELKRAQYG